MSCITWNERLVGRLYGEISSEDDAALATHLGSCVDCRATLERLERVRTLLRDDEPIVQPVPRVVVLKERTRFRPALLAASVMGALILAGAAAGAGYGFGRGHASTSTNVADATPAASPVLPEDLIRREVDRRLAAWQASLAGASTPKGATHAEIQGERPVSAAALRAEFAKFERRMNGARAADLDYVVDQIAASEQRVGDRIGKTNQALRTVALASNPYVNAQ